MAEHAPLTIAHAHARKAAEETEHINWTGAAEEHQHAATDYAKAARGTSDSEALRVLNLLEEQHLKLARIIKDQDISDKDESGHYEASEVADAIVSKHDFAAQPDKAAAPVSARTKSTTSALAAARFGSKARDSSPSLARDIASRRGIPQTGRNPPSAAAQARARQLSPESHRRNRSGPAPKIPPSVMDSQRLQPTSNSKKADDDDAFAKFYSTLTTGTMSKLSSVLAYAGLPLTAEDAMLEQSKQGPSNRNTVSANEGPYLNRIFSKAALDAIEDDHRQRGNHGDVFGPSESFYVVQKGGGTFSYADMAKHIQQPQTPLAGIDEDDEDAFVDAREAQGPSSPRHSRVASQSRISFGKSRTHEELELENTTLKTTLEQLATRLADFETHAQDASMAALTQSMASVHSPQVLTSGTDAALSERLRLLEKQVEKDTEERQRLQSLAAKQEKTLKQYKSKWDDLKKNAREKERAKKEKSDKAADEVPAGVMEAS